VFDNLKYIQYLVLNKYCEFRMKKIPISNFRKKHGSELFDEVSKVVKKSSVDAHNLKNSVININHIIRLLPENEIKSKFINWSSGYDFAVIDVV